MGFFKVKISRQKKFIWYCKMKTVIQTVLRKGETHEYKDKKKIRNDPVHAFYRCYMVLSFLYRKRRKPYLYRGRLPGLCLRASGGAGNQKPWDRGRSALWDVRCIYVFSRSTCMEFLSGSGNIPDQTKGKTERLNKISFVQNRMVCFVKRHTFPLCTHFYEKYGFQHIGYHHDPGGRIRCRWRKEWTAMILQGRERIVRGTGDHGKMRFYL